MARGNGKPFDARAFVFSVCNPETSGVKVEDKATRLFVKVKGRPTDTTPEGLAKQALRQTEEFSVKGKGLVCDDNERQKITAAPKISPTNAAAFIRQSAAGTLGETA